jgi:hypothetical protein
MTDGWCRQTVVLDECAPAQSFGMLRASDRRIGSDDEVAIETAAARHDCETAKMGRNSTCAQLVTKRESMDGIGRCDLIACAEYTTLPQA